MIFFSETLCNKTIPNGQLSDTCGVNVGDTCNNFTCDYGFHELTGIQPFDCTEQGTWDYNMSSLCIGKSDIIVIYMHYRFNMLIRLLQVHRI